jgi:uncharacterized protein YbjT (DUF2867 family)
MADAPILVLGATGAQGGATVRALRARELACRALTRKPDGPAAAALRARGAEVVAGDMDDADSLRRAMQGCRGVFSVQNWWERKNDEVAQGCRVADLARECGVEHLVYTSVARAHDHPDLAHFTTKWKVEQHLHGLDLSWTILRPVYFMDNLFHDQGASFHWRCLAHFVGADSRLQMIATDDIAAFALLAFEAPGAWRGRTVELAGDDLSGADAKALWTEVMGAPPKAAPVPGFVLESTRWWMPELWKMFTWYRKPVFTADIAALRQEHPGLLDLRSFLERRKAASA